MHLLDTCAGLPKLIYTFFTNIFDKNLFLIFFRVQEVKVDDKKTLWGFRNDQINRICTNILKAIKMKCKFVERIYSKENATEEQKKASKFFFFLVHFLIPAVHLS